MYPKEIKNRLFRIIEGSVYDACRSHPEWLVDNRLIKSITKRATGTLYAEMCRASARPSGGVSEVESMDNKGCNVDSRVDGNGNGRHRLRRKGGRIIKRSPFLRKEYKILFKNMSMLAADARKENRPEKLEGIIECLRLLKSEMEKNECLI